jgi:hypothetical protein
MSTFQIIITVVGVLIVFTVIYAIVSMRRRFDEDEIEPAGRDSDTLR